MAFLYRSLWIVMRVQASCEQSQSFENEYFCTMLLVIASVEQCHGICHRNTALKSINKAFLTCWRKKKKARHKYFIFRIAYGQSRQLWRQLGLSVLCRAAAALLPQFSPVPRASAHTASTEGSHLSARTGKMHPCSQLTDCRVLTSEPELVLSV